MEENGRCLKKKKADKKVKKRFGKMKRVNTGITKKTFFKSGMQFGLTMGPETSQVLIKRTLDENSTIDYGIFSNTSFPFENLVLEGGGMKGLAYIGAFEVLERANILRQIKRVCGVSIGSVLAVFLVCGYTIEEMQEIMLENLSDITIDHKCGLCSLIPNVRKKYGWNPGKRYTKWIGKIIENKLGDKDLTFKQLFTKTRMELCVVVTNLTQMVTEYFHVKTTPDLPIAEAVRMSTAIPGMFQASIVKNENGSKDVYVDGGILCNYPIHSFDGWWLSLKQEDSFFKRLTPTNNCSEKLMKNERFSPYNEATLGMVLYSDDEAEPMKLKFERRKNYQQPHGPNTKFFKHQKHHEKLEDFTHKNDNNILEGAIKKMSKVLEDMETLDDGSISKALLQEELKQIDFTSEEIAVLFDVSSIKDVDININGRSSDSITYKDFVSFVEKRGVQLTERFLGYSKRKINKLSDFLSALESALYMSLMRGFVEERDVERTIGINTGYVGTTDFKIENADRQYLIECGELAARAFLREYCSLNSHLRKSSSGLISKTYIETLNEERELEKVENNTINECIMSKVGADFDNPSYMEDDDDNLKEETVVLTSFKTFKC